LLLLINSHGRSTLQCRRPGREQTFRSEGQGRSGAQDDFSRLAAGAVSCLETRDAVWKEVGHVVSAAGSEAEILEIRGRSRQIAPKKTRFLIELPP
jgi:hypothetical protein